MRVVTPKTQYLLSPLGMMLLALLWSCSAETSGERSADGDNEDDEFVEGELADQTLGKDRPTDKDEGIPGYLSDIKDAGISCQVHAKGSNCVAMVKKADGSFIKITKVKKGIKIVWKDPFFVELSERFAQLNCKVSADLLRQSCGFDLIYNQKIVFSFDLSERSKTNSIKTQISEEASNDFIDDGSNKWALWDEGEPSNFGSTGEESCAVMWKEIRDDEQLGFWNDECCSWKARVACKKTADNTWFISSADGIFSEAKSICSAVPGAVFTKPMNSLDNENLKMVLNKESDFEVWINFNDIHEENNFTSLRDFTDGELSDSESCGPRQ